MNEQSENPTDIAGGDKPAEATGCGDTREITIGESKLPVTCTREAGHLEDHFDEHAGIGWYNEGDAQSAGLTQEERAGIILDRLGVPRGRDGKPWTLPQRLNLFVDRLSRRLHTQVENNMLLFALCKDVRVLLEGAPNSGEYRTRTAIKKLRDATTVTRGGIIIES